MQTPLNASASEAGALLSNTLFEVPQFQREYSWQSEEVGDFWTDLKSNISADSYFLGLVILTDEANRKHVVDGQQRLITLSLLSAALYHEAIARGREALADRISANFLKSFDYETDEIEPRVVLSDEVDNTTFQRIIDQGRAPSAMFEGDSVSEKLIDSFNFLQRNLQEDLKADPFKRLGAWTEFLTHRLYFAVFVHPEPASAYQVFEVINTRGRELTTADLLKNHVLAQTKPSARQARYEQWQALAKQFPADGTNNFVQFIRHVITVENGHVLPKDLYAFLAGKLRGQQRPPHSPDELLALLEKYAPLYSQMIDPDVGGPAHPDMLPIFAAMNSLGVIAVRPILLAIGGTDNPIEGMRYVLRLVVRRIVVGNLGTGNVERRFGEAAKKVRAEGHWEALRRDLRDLDPSPRDFESQLTRRSLNKGVLIFLRRSIVQGTITPEGEGFLHFICPRQAEDWEGMDEEDRAFWSSTLGNTFLSVAGRRVFGSTDWEGFKANMLETAVDGEISDILNQFDVWDTGAIEQVGGSLAEIASDVWYG